MIRHRATQVLNLFVCAWLGYQTYQLQRVRERGEGALAAHPIFAGAPRNGGDAGTVPALGRLSLATVFAVALALAHVVRFP